MDTHDSVGFQNFKILHLIGEGAYGKVFLVKKVDGVDQGEYYAMKMFPKRKILEDRKQISYVLAERECLLQLSNLPFLSQLYYAFQTSDSLCLVLDFIQGGDLFHHTFYHRLTQDQARFFIAQTIVALKQLHERNIIYRDLKLENLLIDNDGNLVLADFGLARVLPLHQRINSMCGTLEYLAPEMIEGNGYSFKVDWWALGVLMVELLTGGKSPFATPDEYDTLMIVNRIKTEAPYIGNIHNDAKDLIEKLLEKDEDKRLGTFNDIKNHPFFTCINWNSLMDKGYASPLNIDRRDKGDVGKFDSECTRQDVRQTLMNFPQLNFPPANDLFKGFSFTHTKFIFANTPPTSLCPSLAEVYEIANVSDFFKKYQLIDYKRALGCGTFALCVKCRLKETGELFAVKIMRQECDVKEELELLHECQDGEYIVKLIETMNDAKFTYIVFELLSGGDLFTRILAVNYFDEEIARMHFKRILNGISHLHTKGIVHKDLKPGLYFYYTLKLNQHLFFFRKYRFCKCRRGFCFEDCRFWIC